MTETFNIILDSTKLLEVFFFAFAGFLLGMALTPLYTTLAYRGQWWKKQRDTAITGEKAPVFAKLHAAKHRRNIPTMAGLIFVVAVIIITLCFNLSRAQTWLPLAAFTGAALLGLLDDVINLKGSGRGIAGLPSRLKFLLTAIIALIGGLFFYFKLDVDAISVPGLGEVAIGWLIIPLFVLVVVATANAVNMSDGLDGLAGGLAATAFSTYAIIAFVEQRYGVAGFCMTVVGALLSYTWFNIYPARFFMGDAGSFALGTSLGVVAMITDTVLLLPIIGGVFVIEAGSVIIQVISKKLRGGKKIFKSSPIHHHLEASGWPETKITMRFWVLGQVCAFVGLMIFLLDIPHA